MPERFIGKQKRSVTETTQIVLQTVLLIKYFSNKKNMPNKLQQLVN